MSAFNKAQIESVSKKLFDLLQATSLLTWDERQKKQHSELGRSYGKDNKFLGYLDFGQTANDSSKMGE